MGRAQLIKKSSLGKPSKPFSSAGSHPEPAGATRASRFPALSLNILALFAVIFALQWAREVLIPLALALFISYLLDPVVLWMERRKIPRSIGAALLLLAVIAGLGATTYGFGRQGEAILEQLPEAAHKFRQSLQVGRGDPEGTLNKVQKAANELEKAASEATEGTAPPPPKQGTQKVEVARPMLNLRDYIWVGTIGAFGMALQALLIFFLVYFLLMSGNVFRRRLVKIAGPSFTRRRLVLEILDEIDMQIKQFLLVQLYTSLFMAVAVWLAFRWVGLENAGMWGIVAGILKSIPFIGGAVIVGGTALVAYLQFGTISMALLVAGISIGLKSLEGLLVSPLMISKRGQIHTVWVFVSILFWGWIWGVWGLLLGIPIMMIVKAVCDRIEPLKPVGELLGD